MRKARSAASTLELTRKRIYRHTIATGVAAILPGNSGRGRQCWSSDTIERPQYPREVMRRTGQGHTLGGVSHKKTQR